MRMAPAFAAVATVVVAFAVAFTAAACSSPPQAEDHQPGTLAIGTAKVSVDGADAGTTDSVSCTTTGPLTTITTGDDRSGSVSIVSNADALIAQTVSINNLGGFTGSYNAGLGGEATVTMTGRTYTIEGTADGFRTDDPSFRASGSFTITVAC
jgi:ipoprotein LpqH